MTSQIAELLDAAMERRKSAISEFDATNVWRLLHSAGDGVRGVTVDVVGDVLLVEQHAEEANREDVLAALENKFPNAPIFLKQRWSNDSAARCGWQVRGEEISPVVEVIESGLKFGVNLAGDEHIGMFLDSRPARALVRRISAQKRVLNLFSYTAGFGMAAASGGAISTVNIDNKNSASRVGRENYDRNNLESDSRTFFKCDALYYLKRAAMQKGRFDLIIVDPPPRFKRRRAADFLSHKHYGKLLASCVDVAEGRGSMILAGLNSLKAGWEVLEKAALEAGGLKGVQLEQMLEIGPGADFPECEDRPVARFQLLVIK